MFVLLIVIAAVCAHSADNAPWPVEPLQGPSYTQDAP